jgi:hypothetical protein
VHVSEDRTASIFRVEEEAKQEADGKQKTIVFTVTDVRTANATR